MIGARMHGAAQNVSQQGYRQYVVCDSYMKPFFPVEEICKPLASVRDVFVQCTRVGRMGHLVR